MMYDGGWAWWTGPIYADPFYRPIWAPAYVSFFGYGGGFGFGFGGGWGSGRRPPLGPCGRFPPRGGRDGGRRRGNHHKQNKPRAGCSPARPSRRFEARPAPRHPHTPAPWAPP